MSRSSWTATAAGRRRAGLPRLAGHRAGVEALRKTRSRRRRDRHRVAYRLCLLVGELVAAEVRSQRPDGPAASCSSAATSPNCTRMACRVRIIGDRTGLQPDIKALLDEAEALTAANRALNLVIAFNYGGRDEIVRAARKIAAGGRRRGELDSRRDHAGGLRRTLDTARHSRSGSRHPHQRRAAAFEFPAVAGGL